MLLVQEAQLTIGISEVFCFIYPNSDCFWTSLPVVFKDCGSNPEVEMGNHRISFSSILVARLSGFEYLACMRTSSVIVHTLPTPRDSCAYSSFCALTKAIVLGF